MSVCMLFVCVCVVVLVVCMYRCIRICFLISLLFFLSFLSFTLFVCSLLRENISWCVENSVSLGSENLECQVRNFSPNKNLKEMQKSLTAGRQKSFLKLHVESWNVVGVGKNGVISKSLRPVHILQTNIRWLRQSTTWGHSEVAGQTPWLVLPMCRGRCWRCVFHAAKPCKIQGFTSYTHWLFSHQWPQNGFVHPPTQYEFPTAKHLVGQWTQEWDGGKKSFFLQ